MTEPLSSAGTLEHVNPNDLMIEMNVRTEAGLTKQFIESIRENGVLVPVVAVRAPDGTLYVRMGQRRTAAAREVGLATIPVYVTDADVGTATRVSTQMVENDHRAALRSEERVAGIQTMLDTGMSITKVAKALSVSPERVKKSRAVASSAIAMEALTARTATLDEAAGLAEFEDDPEAVERLLLAARRNYFDSELERLRRARTEQRAREAAADEYRAKGYSVLDAYPVHDLQCVPLAHLLKGGEPATEADVSAEAVAAGHWALILTEDEVFTDAEGNRVDESLIDWSTEGNPEAVPAEGMLHADTVVETGEYVPSGYFCLNPEAVGLVVSERFTKLVEAAAGGEVPASSPANPEEAAAAKAERRRTIAMNKAGEAAEVVRREFVAGLLKRKTVPKGAMVFITERLTHAGTLLGSYRGDEIAGELLGSSVRDGSLLDQITDGRAEVIMLGMTIGALEAMTPKSAWRAPSQESASYLRFLADNGYGLSPVERVITGEITVDSCLEHLS